MKHTEITHQSGAIIDKYEFKDGDVFMIVRIPEEFNQPRRKITTEPVTEPMLLSSYDKNTKRII